MQTVDLFIYLAALAFLVWLLSLLSTALTNKGGALKSIRTLTADQLSAGATLAMAFFSAVTLVLGVLAYSISQGQMALLRRQLDSMEREQEARFSVLDEPNGPVFERLNEQGTAGIIRWHVAYTNSGKGDARNFTSEILLKVGNSGFRSSGGFGTPLALPAYAPGQKSRVTGSSNPVPEAFFDALKKVDGGIAVLIIFSYEDIFGKHHEDVYCKGLLASGAIANALPDSCKRQIVR